MTTILDLDAVEVETFEIVPLIGDDHDPGAAVANSQVQQTTAGNVYTCCISMTCGNESWFGATCAPTLITCSPNWCDPY